MVDIERISLLNDQPSGDGAGPVLYWMQADQRAEDNWALLRAVELANERGVPVVVAFFVFAVPGGAYVRHYDFMLRGMAETADRIRERGIGFVMRVGNPVQGVPELAKEIGASAVVTDQNYLRWGQEARAEVAAQLDMPMAAVDAGTVVPPKLAYPKAAYGAYILRPKLRKLRERYITEFPAVEVKRRWEGEHPAGEDLNDIEGIMTKLELDGSVGPVEQAAGAAAAMEQLMAFMGRGFKRYDEKRNDPTVDATSRLSAYLHFGQISVQRVAYEVLNSDEYDIDSDGAEAFLDELITWRELAVNHVLYRPRYDAYEAIPDWAKRSLEKHADDPREAIYTSAELEAATTHDELWNAAQLEMVRTGRMHGYMRMYWAKKILEWSESPVRAIEAAVYLNDKYLLDGRDPNGYAGILWAIGGLHDRPWFDRPIYGQVRYMSYGGAKGKFDVAAYVKAFTK